MALVHKRVHDLRTEPAPLGYATTACDDEYLTEAVKNHWSAVTCPLCLLERPTQKKETDATEH